MPISYRAGDSTPKGTEITAGLISAVSGDDAGNLIIIEDNAEQIENAINHALAVGLESVGLTCERFAKGLCPVDTGRLRNSITHSLAVDDKYVIVGTNVEYAKYVELNEKAHHESGQAHFLHDAAANHGKTYHDILESALRDA